MPISMLFNVGVIAVGVTEMRGMLIFTRRRQLRHRGHLVRNPYDKLLMIRLQDNPLSW